MDDKDTAGTGPRVGSRVHVWDVDETDLGFGTYVGNVLVSEIPDDDPVSSTMQMPVLSELTPDQQATVKRMTDNLMKDDATTPKIVLESGRVIYGFACWWKEAEETQSTN